MLQLKSTTRLCLTGWLAGTLVTATRPERFRSYLATAASTGSVEPLLHLWGSSNGHRIGLTPTATTNLATTAGTRKL